jgi:competence protein ComEA
MGELLRPPPPRSWRDRVAARLTVVTPARVASGAGAVLLVAVTAWWLLRPGRLPVEASLPRASTPVASARSASSTSPAAASTTVPAAPLVVQAAGAVARPGVYRLPDGARVADLVDAAGGPAVDADLDRVALAARLVDGQRVAVPRRGEPTAAEPSSGVPAGAVTTVAAGPVDLNAATVDDLDRLPGVGPATAAAIVAYRERQGPFRSVDELTEVPGIGPSKLAALRDLVTV